MQKPENYPQEPKHLWDIFYDFTQTPRPSKHEEKISRYLIDLAEKNSLSYKIDETGNIVIYVPGKNGGEKSEPLIIQNHIDMVTDAIAGKNVNFKEDPIEVYVKDQWLKADGTTLGADNGIGCAAALATIFEKDIKHPPLELLFTVDEETGLNGALGLDPKNLKAKRMLNLDTEEWGSLYIGCAGGIDYEFNKDMQLIDSSFDARLKITLSDLSGGHSGVQIHEQRGNAIELLSDFLYSLNKEADFAIEKLKAGRAHNIIPRDSECIIHCSKKGYKAVEKLAGEKLEQWRSFLPKVDHKLLFNIEELELSGQKTIENTKRLLQFLSLFPNGAHRYDIPSGGEIVSMSNNFARLLLIEDKFYVQSSLRFFDRQEVKLIENRLNALADLFEAKVEKKSEYPSWKPVRDNSILDIVQETYQDLFGTKAQVTAIHAGLECGILRDKIGPIDVVSFGPTITGAHSPDEQVDIESVTKFWDLFKAVLERM